MHLKVSDIANDLGVSTKTVQKYCKSGFLPTEVQLIGEKTVFLVPSREYLNWKQVNFGGNTKKVDKRLANTAELSLDSIKHHKEVWIEWCATGKRNGKPISPRTVELYSYYFDYYLKNLGQYPKKPIISKNNLRLSLGAIDVTSFSTRVNIYFAVMSFSKYLIEICELNISEREELRKLKPKRLLPAKKTSATEAELDKFIDVVDSIESYGEYDRITMKTIIQFLANTGLRASEFSNLRLQDVDLDQRLVI